MGQVTTLVPFSGREGNLEPGSIVLQHIPSAAVYSLDDAVEALCGNPDNLDIRGTGK